MKAEKKKLGIGGLPVEITEYVYWSRFLIYRRIAFFAKGEKYCKRCEYVFKPTWPYDRCPSCGTLLRYTPRHRKRRKLVNEDPHKVGRE